ncbi:MAG: hypothetical protein WC732_01470 [Candidatus Omnitrophota bacterium]
MKQSTFDLLAVLALSFVPGLPHLYLKKYKKAVSLLFISAGIVLTLLLSNSYVSGVLMFIIYAVTAIPSGVEAYQLCRYGRQTLDISSRWYVLLLLWWTGFSAVPLLWQSNRFSRFSKVVLTFLVAVMAVLFFSFLVYYWKFLEDFLTCLLSRRCGY